MYNWLNTFIFVVLFFFRNQNESDDDVFLEPENPLPAGVRRIYPSIANDSVASLLHDGGPLLPPDTSSSGAASPEPRLPSPDPASSTSPAERAGVAPVNELCGLFSAGSTVKLESLSWFTQKESNSVGVPKSVVHYTLRIQVLISSHFQIAFFLCNVYNTSSVYFNICFLMSLLRRSPTRKRQCLIRTK
jgi:hypothetical protein